MRPSIGRVVHYVSFGTPGGEFGQECRAAIVTEVGETWVPEGHPKPEGTPVGLAVLSPTGMFFNRGIAYDEGRSPGTGAGGTMLCTGKDHSGGTWHWPARIDS